MNEHLSDQQRPYVVEGYSFAHLIFRSMMAWVLQSFGGQRPLHHFQLLFVYTEDLARYTTNRPSKQPRETEADVPSLHAALK